MLLEMHTFSLFFVHFSPQRALPSLNFLSFSEMLYSTLIEFVFWSTNLSDCHGHKLTRRIFRLSCSTATSPAYMKSTWFGEKKPCYFLNYWFSIWMVKIRQVLQLLAPLKNLTFPTFPKKSVVIQIVFGRNSDSFIGIFRVRFQATAWILDHGVWYLNKIGLNTEQSVW